MLYPPSLMFRSSFLKKYNLNYNTGMRYAADYELLTRCSRLFPIRNIETILLKYRVHTNQISTDKKAEQAFWADTVRLGLLNQFSIMYNEQEVQLHLKLMKGVRLTEDELAEAVKWMNKLLDANEKLKLYNSKYLYDVLKAILMASVQRNQLGGWSIEKELVKFINEKLPENKTLIEFGSGTGTEALLKSYKVISVEHDLCFVRKRAKHHICIHSPIKDNWYDSDKVKITLEKTHDMILIDGPVGHLRSGILKNLDLFRKVVAPVIFDDMDRPCDKEIMISFCKELNYHYEIHEGERKKFAYCTKK